MTTYKQNKLKDFYYNNKTKAQRIIFISSMVFLSFFSVNFDINSIVLALLLTALYLKK